MSLIIIAFKTAPVPDPEWKAKDETLDNEIRKKTMGNGHLSQPAFAEHHLLCLDRNLQSQS